MDKSLEGYGPERLKEFGMTGNLACTHAKVAEFLESYEALESICSESPEDCLLGDLGP